jgi:mono/diheme cytochrome c family protein
MRPNRFELGDRRGRRPLIITAALVLFTAGTTSIPAGAADTASVRYPDGATVFQANCAVCHGAKGAGTPSLAPPVTSYPARYAATEDGRKQLAMTVLNGMFGGIEVEQKHFDFKMPDFARLDDATLAAVLNFVVFDLAHAPDSTKPLTPEEIAAERSHPVDGAAVREHRAKLLASPGL